jgi:predicted helicase
MPRFRTDTIPACSCGRLASDRPSQATAPDCALAAGSTPAARSELGLPVTTDPDRIAAFLRRRGRRVVFATYQSSPQIAAAYKGRVPSFDLADADEAHRCAGRVGNEFTTILDAGQIRSKRRLFMTATLLHVAPAREAAGTWAH